MGGRCRMRMARSFAATGPTTGPLEIDYCLEMIVGAATAALKTPSNYDAIVTTTSRRPDGGMTGGFATAFNCYRRAYTDMRPSRVNAMTSYLSAGRPGVSMPGEPEGMPGTAMPRIFGFSDIIFLIRSAGT